MTKCDLDNILGAETPIEPSPHFAPGVMRAIRQETLAPAPIRFPWARLAAGIGTAIGVCVIAGSTTLLGPDAANDVLQLAFRLKHIAVSTGLAWIIGGAILSYFSVKLTLRFSP